MKLMKNLGHDSWCPDLHSNRVPPNTRHAQLLSNASVYNVKTAKTTYRKPYDLMKHVCA
jgi:hypothetical protein